MENLQKMFRRDGTQQVEVSIKSIRKGDHFRAENVDQWWLAENDATLDESTNQWVVKAEPVSLLLS